MAKRLSFMLGALLIGSRLLAGDVVPKFVKAPTVLNVADGKLASSGQGNFKIEFTLDSATDVEVSIQDAKGGVVRHLAAGMLGREAAPPAPLKAGLSQSLAWDGNDDYGQPVKDAATCTVCVRAGMGLKLDKIVGGDPYAYYSKEMGQGDHAAWRITGLEVKPDGNVYVMGNVNNFGPPALRKYDAAGNFLSTVYPPPAGKPLEAMSGWGLHIRADGTYTPNYSDLSSPALSKTFIAGTRGGIATLVPSPGNDRLLLVSPDFKLMTINVDGTLPPNPVLAGLLVNEPVILHPDRSYFTKPWEVTGQMQISLSPDGKSFYLGGLCARMLEKSKVVGVDSRGPWRDGQIFKVDSVTRKASVFFALPASDVISDMDAREKSPITDARYGNYAALQGVAVDAEGRVFVGDRQNRRVLVLDGGGKILREIPCEYPDAIAVPSKSKELFVTTRTGQYHEAGKLTLLKFNDWSKDSAPAQTLTLCEVKAYGQATHVAVAEAGGNVYVWVAYSGLPVHVYKDTDKGLQLAKDFYEAGPQCALDLQHFIVDQKTGDLYVSDGWGNVFRINDWKQPQFVRCMQDEKTPLKALSLAIDSRGRHLYGHADRQPVARYMMDGPYFGPDPAGDSHLLTPKMGNDWRIGLGFGDRGIAAAPDGSLATLGQFSTAGGAYAGPLTFFRADMVKAPWESLSFKGFGEGPRSGGIRFDPQGNLYVGKVEGKPRSVPVGFEKDNLFAASMGNIYKYAPTGLPGSGSLFPREPGAPVKVYDVHYGAIGPEFSRTPRFGVDGYGRIYYPTSLEPRVSVIDNEGNAILSFGTYGNRDSMGGLPGDLVPTKDIPMAWPNSVDATDDYIYVSDILNIRLMRLAKTYRQEFLIKIQN